MRRLTNTITSVEVIVEVGASLVTNTITCVEVIVEVVSSVVTNTIQNLSVLASRVEPRQLTTHVVTRRLERVVRGRSQHHVTVEVKALVAAALAVVVDVVCGSR